MKSSRNILFSIKRKSDRKFMYMYMLTLITCIIVLISLWISELDTLARQESLRLIETQIRIESYLNEKGFNLDLLDHRSLNDFLGEYNCLIITPRDKELPEIIFHSNFMKGPPPKYSTIDKFVRKLIYFSLPSERAFITTDNYNGEKQLYINLKKSNGSAIVELSNDVSIPNFKGTFKSTDDLTGSLLMGAKDLLDVLILVFVILSMFKFLLFRIAYRSFVLPLRSLNDCLDHAMETWEVKPSKMEKTASEDVNEVAKKMHCILENMVDLYNSTQDFLEEAAHEIKNPLNNIINTSELIKDIDSEIGEDMDLIINQAYTINSLIDGLRGAVELQIIGDTPRKADSNVEQILKDVVQEFEAIYADREFVLEIKNGFDKHSTMDEKLLNLIIRNILGNALKYSKENSPITVTLATRNLIWIELNVANFGPGIPVDKQDKIFEKYYRGEATAEKVPGSGLGLWIVKELIDRHKGYIFARSANGITTFSIILRSTFEQVEAGKEYMQPQNQNETDTWQNN